MPQYFVRYYARTPIALAADRKEQQSGGIPAINFQIDQKYADKVQAFDFLGEDEESGLKIHAGLGVDVPNPGVRNRRGDKSGPPYRRKRPQPSFLRNHDGMQSSSADFRISLRSPDSGTRISPRASDQLRRFRKCSRHAPVSQHQRNLRPSFRPI